MGSQLSEAKVEAQSTQQRLQQEMQLKEDYNKEYQRALFNLKRMEDREKEDREVLNKRL